MLALGHCPEHSPQSEPAALLNLYLDKNAPGRKEPARRARGGAATAQDGFWIGFAAADLVECLSVKLTTL